MNLKQRIIDRLSFGMTDTIVKGQGYEALILKKGIVVACVYLGTIEEMENEADQ